MAMIIFMLFLLTFVFLSTKQTPNLVEKDYYPKALEYQDKIDKISNSDALAEKVKIENNKNNITIRFQSFFNPSDIQGEIVFYRPSDKREDIIFEVKPDSNGVQYFDVSKMLVGKYIIKIDYEVNGTAYFQEESVLVKMF